MLKALGNKTNLQLLLIVVVASILRFYHLTSFSLSNDELSALARVQFDNFNDLIEKGVIGDFHPAGVQIFLYFWVKLFGQTEFAIRFPFALMGVFSVVLIFLIAKKWFNEYAALFSAAALAFLQFPVLYSQLERPYSSGLFLSLLMVYCWTKVLFDSDNSKKIIYSILYALSTAFCMYNHYFSFLFAVIVGISGLPFVRKQNAFYLLGAAILSVLLFLPHINITLTQMSRGGLSEWLGKPAPDTLKKYLFYISNNSLVIIVLFSISLLVTIINNTKKKAWNKFHIISVAWFLLPFLIAYFYSLKVNPVYQHSIMIFSMSYLLLFIFSGFDFQEKNSIILLSITSAILLFSTIIEKKYYRTRHWPEFKEIAELITKYNSDFGSKNITQVGTYNSPFYLNYYLDKFNQPFNLKKHLIETTKDVVEVDSIVKASPTEYFSYTWSCRYSFPEIEQSIRKKYPVLVRRESYYMDSVKVSEYSLFKKGNDDRKKAIDVNLGFTSSVAGVWEYDNNRVKTKDNLAFFSMNKEMEYSPTLQTSVKDLYKSDNCNLEIEADYILKEPGEILLVLTFDNEQGNYLWFAKNLYEYTNKLNVIGTTFISFPRPANSSANDKVKIYLWNKSKSEFEFLGLRIKQYFPD